MRIEIDTEKECIIVPDSFFKQIDEKNKVLTDQGITDRKIDYTQFVKDSFDKAVKNPFIRKSDLKRK